MMGGPAIWWWWAGLAAIWLPVFGRLSEVWRIDEEMRHGWLVPILVAYMAWERVAQFRRGSGPGRGAVAVVLGGLMGLGLSLWVLVANPLWPTMMWATVGFGAVTTLGWIAGMHGWGMARQCVPLVALLFLALPWPTKVQKPVTLGLAQMNAHVAAEVVSAQGYPAAVHGRVIEVGAGIVGVEEACSGIRSLQAVTMAAIFLAALFQLGWRRGLGLLAAGWLVAVLGNLIRTCFLVHTLAKSGHERMNAVHDAAGNGVLLVTLGVMAAAAWLLPTRVMGVARPSATPGSDSFRRLGRWAAALVAVVALSQCAIWWWYGSGPANQARTGWKLADDAGGNPEAIPAEAADLLNYTVGAGRSWLAQGDDPARLAFLFHWDGDLMFLNGAALHDPTLCLPGIGSQLESEIKGVALDWPTASLPLRAYRFRTRAGRTQFVFFQVWDAFRAEVWPQGRSEEGFGAARWQRVLDRRRSSDVYQLIMVFEEELTDEQAIARAERLMPRIFSPI